MNLKNKWKKFWTLTKRQNGGFTLVELIVVIAILAILAGVGSAAYSGYIKNANKGADRTLVGHIIRAIETGTYSYAAKIEEVVQVSENAKLPVGFIVLTTEGGEIMQSQSTQLAIQANEKCNIQKIDFYKATADGQDSYNRWGWTHDVYTLEVVESINICTTHSSYISQNYRTWNTASKDTNSKAADSTENNYPMAGNNTLALPADGHVHGEYYTGSQYNASVDAAGNYFPASNSGPLYDAIVLAFGEDPDLSISYDGWTSSSIPSFWSDATTAWENVKTLADMMQNITQGKIGGIDFGILSGIAGSVLSEAMDINQYNSSAEIVYSVSQAVEGSFADDDGMTGKQKFVEQWNSYGNYTDAEKKYGGDKFGIASAYTGREYYSAMRGAYNNCVSSYVAQHHTHDGYTQAQIDAHVAALAGYGESAGELIEGKLGGGALASFAGAIGDAMADENVPRQLCKASFTSTDADAIGYLGDAHGCAECKRLYSEYVDSGADEADAAAVYDTFLTAAHTDPVILNGEAKDANGNTVDFFSYYKAQLEEYEGMYGAATEMANGQSAIVIQVFYENGSLVCDVTPVEANPRND